MKTNKETKSVICSTSSIRVVKTGQADFHVDSDGVLIDCKLKGQSDTLNVSTEVVRISRDAFKNIPGVEHISLPDTVIDIDAGAFSGLKHLQTVLLSSKIPEIPEETFVGCVKLQYISPFSNIKRIGEKAFVGCLGLNILNLGEVEEIGDFVFEGCSKLETIVLSDNLKKIGKGAFFKCKALKSIQLNDGITSIGKGAFSHTGLSKITIPHRVSRLESRTFEQCPNLVSVAAPSVELLNTKVFDGSNNLKEIEVAESCKVAKQNIGERNNTKRLTVKRVTRSLSRKF